MSDKEAAKYVDGVALHTYLDKVYSSEMLDIFHDTYPNLFIINTEFCIIAFLSVGKYSCIIMYWSLKNNNYIYSKI